jgi:hypothetical protein
MTETPAPGPPGHSRLLGKLKRRIRANQLRAPSSSQTHFARSGQSPTPIGTTFAGAGSLGGLVNAPSRHKRIGRQRKRF